MEGEEDVFEGIRMYTQRKKKRKERKGWIKLEKINFTYLLGFLFGD